MKRIFAIIFVISIVISTLVSCGHTHEWSEWETTTYPSVFETGLAERTCECGDKETKVLDAYSIEEFYSFLNGHWREVGATKEDFLIDIVFQDNTFVATVYMSGTIMNGLGSTGEVVITKDAIYLKKPNGSLYTMFLYPITKDGLALIEIGEDELFQWEKYLP